MFTTLLNLGCQKYFIGRYNFQMLADAGISSDKIIAGNTLAIPCFRSFLLTHYCNLIIHAHNCTFFLVGFSALSTDMLTDRSSNFKGASAYLSYRKN